MNSQKKKILIFIDWFLPGYKAGGPIQSVFNLVDRLSDTFDFYVVTSDRDINQNSPYQEVNFNSWTKYKNVNVQYLTADKQSFSYYKQLLQEQEYSRIYLNSMFSIKFSMLPLLAALKANKQVVLAPRGMLGQGALRLGSLKKKVFIAAFKLFNIHKKIVWQATAESEKNEIEAVFGKKIKIKIAPNLGKQVVTKPTKNAKVENEVNLFFLSRISKKKNLLAAIQYLKLVESKHIINFDIIGPIEEELYWNDCLNLVKGLNKNVKVNYVGAIPNHDLQKALENYHFMLLPTFNENFGHVIMEAWQNACPVIISDQTPWRDLEDKNIGWDISLDKVDTFVKAIEQTAKMNEEEYIKWSDASFGFAKSFNESPELIEANKKLFN